METAERSLLATRTSTTASPPRSPPESKFACPYPGCGKQYPELWRLRAHYRSPSAPPRGQSGHDAELAQCPRCNMDLAPGLPHIGCRLGYAAPKQARKRKRAQEQAARERLLRNQSQQAHANPNGRFAHPSGLPPELAQSINIEGNPVAVLGHNVQRVLASCLADRGLVPPPLLQSNQGSSSIASSLPPQVESLVHTFVQQFSQLVARDSTTSTAGDSSHQGTELAWSNHNHHFVEPRATRDDVLPGIDSGALKPPGNHGMAGGPSSYTDMFTHPSGPTIEPPTVRGGHGSASHDGGRVYSHASEQYHCGSSEWGGGSDLGANNFGIGLNGQWIASDTGGGGSEYGVTASEYSANGGFPVGGLGGGGRGGGEMDDSLMALVAKVPEARGQNHPGCRAASDAGVGAWGMGASWQQRRQGLMNIGGGGNGLGEPVRAASEAGVPMNQPQTGSWQRSQKPPGVSRMSLSSMHANDIIPRGLRRLSSVHQNKPRPSGDWSSGLDTWEEQRNDLSDRLSDRLHMMHRDQIPMDSDEQPGRPFEDKALRDSLSVQGDSWRHRHDIRRFSEPQTSSIGDDSAHQGPDEAHAKALKRASRTPDPADFTDASVHNGHHVINRTEAPMHAGEGPPGTARRHLRWSPNAGGPERGQQPSGHGYWHRHPAPQPPIPDHAALSSAAALMSGTQQQPPPRTTSANASPEAAEGPQGHGCNPVPSWLAPLQASGCGICGGVKGTTHDHVDSSCSCPMPEMLTPAANPRLVPVSGAPVRIASMPQLSPRARPPANSPQYFSAGPPNRGGNGTRESDAAYPCPTLGARNEDFHESFMTHKEGAAVRPAAAAASPKALFSSPNPATGDGWPAPRFGSRHASATAASCHQGSTYPMFEEDMQASAAEDFPFSRNSDHFEMGPPQPLTQPLTSLGSLPSNGNNLLQECDQSWIQRAVERIKPSSPPAANDTQHTTGDATLC